MVRDHIFRTVLKKAPKERIEEMLRSIKCHKSVEVIRGGADFSFYDLLDLVDAAGIDIGLTIRTRDGEEVTFYPGQNFGETGGKNGTPREKRAARKPYDPTPTYDYRAQNRMAAQFGAHGSESQLPMVNHLAQHGGLYAQDDDDEPIGPKLPGVHEESCG